MASPELVRNPRYRVAVVTCNGMSARNAYDFERSGIALEHFHDVQALLDERTASEWSAVVVEWGPEAAPSFESLLQLRAQSAMLPILVAVEHQTPEMRARASQCGATEVLRAPLQADQALAAIARHAIGISSRGARTSLGPLIGASEPMQLLYDSIFRIAASSSTILLRGESGTGKELVARTIVLLSSRRDKPFIRLNCAALPESLMESELFGSERGAYTGAVTSRAGHIEMADGGTLFLDEIATLPITLQTKLLRVIEDRTVQRLGSHTCKKIDFRLITATNKDLEQMVKAGRFREDLYYRINVIPIRIPPLRQRRGDIALLAKHFVDTYCAANGIPRKHITVEALDVLEDNSWPGNIRELENLIQRLVLMVQGDTVTVNDLPEQVLYESASRHESLLIPDGGIDFDREMERIEVAYLRAALHRANGKKVAAARLLKVNEQRMKYLCRKYHLGSDENGG